MSATLAALEEIADSFLEILEKAKKGEIYLTPELRQEMAAFIQQTAITRMKLAEVGPL